MLANFLKRDCSTGKIGWGAEVLTCGGAEAFTCGAEAFTCGAEADFALFIFWKRAFI